jgi:NAD(P)-dependent dehydrogenase (short-subunit alcohol dehydrogenase family)
VNNLVTYVVDELGAIDVLLNNVGVMIRKPLMEYSEEEWDRVIDINLKSAFLCSQAVSRVMVTQKKGSIINMSSVCATKASTTRGGYHVAKAGVSMLTKTLALELVGSQVRVNAIAPGGVKTDWNTREWNNSENIKRPMQRMAETYEITGAAIFLASEASSYITGHVLLVDGGESL